MYINKVKLCLIAISVSFITASCTKEEVRLQPLGEERYEPISQSVFYIKSAFGTQHSETILLNKEGKTDLSVHLNQTQEQDIPLRVTYSPEVLEAYNQANKVEYKALPEELVTFTQDIVIPKGERKSTSIDITFKTSESLEDMATYAIPLRAQTVGNELRALGASAGTKVADYVLLVKDISKMPSVEKASGMELISCMEVNDANPLSHLCFTLKSTGQPLFNQVILFSGNINYDAKTGRVYNFNNENVSHLLNNREKYLKPLQEKGIKVILGILGNHDRAGIANLSDEGAKQFAQELKRVLDTYELDGVFFDDEYSNYGTYPGFVDRSVKAASRLCYETKKAIGDKLVEVYVYGYTSYLYEVDGVKPGQYIDYALHDYRAGQPLSNAYPGLPKERWGMYSQELNRQYHVDARTLQKMRQDGYRTHMVFALNPFASNFSYSQKTILERIARAFYDDELVYDGKPYKKDW